MRTQTLLALVSTSQAAQLNLAEHQEKNLSEMKTFGDKNNLAQGEDEFDLAEDDEGSSDDLAQVEDDDGSSDDLAQVEDDFRLAEDFDDDLGLADDYDDNLNDLAEDDYNSELAEDDSDDLGLAEDYDDDLGLADEENFELALVDLDHEIDQIADRHNELELAEEDLQLNELEQKAVDHVLAKLTRRINLAQVDNKTLDRAINYHKDEALAIAYPTQFAQTSDNALATTEFKFWKRSAWRKVGRGIKRAARKVGRFAKKALKATGKFVVNQLKEQVAAFTMKKFTWGNLLRVGLNVGMMFASPGIGSFAGRFAGRFMAKHIGGAILKKVGGRIASKIASRFGRKFVGRFANKITRVASRYGRRFASKIGTKISRNKTFRNFARKNIGRFSKKIWHRTRNLRRKAWRYGIRKAKQQFKGKMQQYYQDSKQKLHNYMNRFRAYRRMAWYKRRVSNMRQQMNSYR